jgi:hypothetical protein
MTVIELLDELHIEHKSFGESPHVTSGWVGLHCCWCPNGSAAYGLGIHLNSLRVSCWACGSHSLGDVLATITGQPWFPTVKGWIARLGRSGAILAPSKPVHVGKYTPPVGVEPLGPAHRKYLVKRGFDPDEIAKVWGVGGIGLALKLQFRLFIPVLVNDKPVSWTTRAIGDAAVRYVSAKPEHESVSLKQTLYGSDKAKQSCVVVEGPVDVWRIGPGAVALYGLSYTPAQVALIAKYPVRAICFDSEPTAQRRARKLAADLAIWPGVTYVVQLSGKDAAEAPAEEISELRRRFLT